MEQEQKEDGIDKETEVYAVPLHSLTFRAGTSKPKEAQGSIELLYDTTSLVKMTCCRSSKNNTSDKDALIIHYGGMRLTLNI